MHVHVHVKPMALNLPTQAVDSETHFITVTQNFSPPQLYIHFEHSFIMASFLQRPGGRESNMYSSSRGNRERFAYEQEINQAVGNRKLKSKKPI